MDKKAALDIAERTLWTAAQAAIAYLIVVTASIPKWWALALAPALAALKGVVAAKLTPESGASPAALPLTRPER